MPKLPKSRLRAAAGAVPTGTTAAGTGAPAGPTLFDDFNYCGHSDPRIAANGWSVRANSGGPGVPGANWCRRTSRSPVRAATR